MLGKLLICALFVTSSLAGFPDYVPADLHEWILGMRAKCTKENGITDADVESYVISNNAQPMMCYMKCMMLESKWMNPHHEIQYKVIENVLQDGELKKILIAVLDKCGSIPEGKDACEKAYNFNVCVQQADPVHYFLP